MSNFTCTAVHCMQICLVKSACSARTNHLSTGIFFNKNNRQSIRDKYMTQLLRVESIRNAFNGILLYNILCHTTYF